MDFLLQSDFWIAVGQIILIDILLGGDNAIVIALACRGLPPKLRRQGILWGTAGAVVLRIALIFFALQLLAIPFLKVVGAVLLVWIGVKLLLPQHEDGHDGIEGSDKLWGAIKTVIVADFVMSVDNVIAIASAAESSGTGHSMVLVIFGVLISIPIIVWGSQLVIRLMDRFPLVITLGAMLLGWIAGTMVVTDPALVNPEVLPQLPKIVPSDTLRYLSGAAGALGVLWLGRWLTARRAVAHAAAPVAPGPVVAGTLRRVLFATDGSPASLRAVERLAAMRSELREPGAMSIELLNVQRPVSSDVSSFVASATLDEYHAEQAEKALAPARAALERQGLAYKSHWRVGVPGPAIGEFARAEGCGLIVMGARGLSGATSALLGSVAQSTIEHAHVPVLVVK